MAYLPTGDVPFTSGARSTVVATLQQMLVARGLMGPPADGVVGPKTIAAVESAITILTNSISSQARAAIANAGTTTQGLVSALGAGFAYHDAATGATGPGAPVASQTTIRMGPADAARMEVNLFGAKIPWWVLLAAAGVGVVVMVSFRPARSRR